MWRILERYPPSTFIVGAEAAAIITVAGPRQFVLTAVCVLATRVAWWLDRYGL